MRFAIDADKMGEYISIGEEIEQVTNLQFLNQLRKNEMVPFNFIFKEEVATLNFIPLVLLTLTENIFKHGHLTSDHPASLDIRIKAGMLIIESNNTSNRLAEGRHTGTGLTNIGQRLKYAYGSDASLIYGLHEDGHFNVRIMVPVQLLHGTAEPLATLANNDKE
jgi:two-component system LytT family sensor kinase